MKPSKLPAAAVLFFGLFLFPGCDAASGADVRVAGGLAEKWRLLASGAGVPDFLAAARPEAAGSGDGGSGDGILLELFSRRGGEVVPAAGTPASGSGVMAEEKVLERRYLAPAVPLLDPRRSVDPGAFTGKLKYLDDILPPEKALAAGGLYPGDAGYPLVEETVLRLSAAPGAAGGAAGDGGGAGKRAEKRFSEALAWMKGLPGPREEKVVRIAAVGDIMAARGVDALLLGGSGGVERVFGDTLPILRGADIALGNIEGALTRRSAKTPKTYNFRFPPEILRPLAAAGFGYLAPTNNHIYDYGEAGLLDTLDALAASGIGVSGLGRNLAEAALPWEGTPGGLRIRIVAAGAYPREASGFDGRTAAAAGKNRPGILWADETALGAMREHFSRDTFDIVMVHGGEEWRSEPSAPQKALYRSFIDAGADLVLGSHPHVLQGIEARGEGLILYSLGNFIFPGMDETRYGEESLIFLAGIFRGAVRYVDFYPVRIREKTVRRDEKSGILERFIRLSERLER